ncbi:alpha/beta fold hydrolase [Bacteroidetes bacterium endosymbiont of Geopemphigus sp.]|uniref:alpha/beta fold hydrolase n=1 Tax=Bacteroidetes bacterium endosymbiont of Geopemphigus sp. TaxID=2047937 RepID=UPI000CD2B756|nr:alpha/beta hydrolase [Bacteroidetes bacterium endosymbiont of Geopemphigus sp.]
MKKPSLLHYKSFGEGSFPIVLLHGFMESFEIWRDLIESLSLSKKIIAIDLPGHGKTPVFGTTHSMEQMAEGVRQVLENEQIEKALFIGHSMGGYVGLALAETNQDLFLGLCLLHSSAAVDSPEKKINRLRSIQFAQEHPVLFINSIIEGLFHADHLKELKDIIEFTKKIALTNPVAGILAALRGMYERKDRCFVLNETSFPKCMIIGAYDNFLDHKNLYEQVKKGKNIYAVEIPTGHMGHLEAPDKVLKVLKKFISEAIHFSGADIL